MSSKPLLISFVRLVFAVALVCCIAGVSRAQTNEGEFTLPFEVQWGSTTLPAGDYSYTLEQPESLVTVPAATIRVRAASDNAVRLAVLAMARPAIQPLQHSSLTLVRNGDKYVVREMYIMELALTFRSPLPKSVPQPIAEGSLLIKRLPVRAAGK